MVAADKTKEETLLAALNGCSRGNRKSRESLWYILADSTDVHMVTRVEERDGLINCSVPKVNINSSNKAIPVFTDIDFYLRSKCGFSEDGNKAIPVFTDIDFLRAWTSKNNIEDFEVIHLKGVSMCETATLEDLTLLFNPSSIAECVFSSYDSQRVLEEAEKIALNEQVEIMNTHTMAFDPLDLVTPEGLRKASKSGNRSF